MKALLQGKVVVVTGGAGLLGREFCRTIASFGGSVVVADVDDVAAARVVSEIDQASRPVSASSVRLNITDKDSISEALATASLRHGRIDAIVNTAYPRNAGYGRRLEDVTYADFCDNVSMHLGGYFLVSQQAAAWFRNHGGGHIVNMASVYGVIPPRFEIYGATGMTMPVEYAAIKSGVLHLTRYFAKYLKGTGIRVNAISPGGILDHQAEEFLYRYRELCSSKGMLDTSDVSGTLVYLLSDLSSFVNGQNIVVDDGFSL